MGKLALLVMTFFSGSFIKQALLGAGLGLVTSTVILTMVNKYISTAITNMSAVGSIAGLMGLAGLDVAMSILIGAIVCRATISTLSTSIGKTGS